jgi:hypothetical protein
LKEVFPLLSCQIVRIDIQLRPFHQVVRNAGGLSSMCNSPLSDTVPFLSVSTDTLDCPPEFRDFRLVSFCSLVDGSLRDKFLRNPFEQLVKLVQPFHFDEPLKYLVNKSVTDRVDIQLPLELNHPVVELLWVFRRKAVQEYNEWGNFSPMLSLEATKDQIYPAWLHSATLRINGSEIISAEGDWFREHIANHHGGGIISYQSSIYGYSFSREPESHQPSGSMNSSRANSVTLTLSVRTPFASNNGWEVFVYAIHYNWLRFENGMGHRMFSS